MLTCTKCNMFAPDSARFCERCGGALVISGKDVARGMAKLGIWVLGPIFGLILLTIVISVATRRYPPPKPADEWIPKAAETSNFATPAEPYRPHTPEQVLGGDKARALDQELDKPGGDSYSARLMCENHFVKDKLLAPTSAKFSGDDETGVTPGKGNWVVRGYVDSQNAFGVMIRSQYVCITSYQGADRWRAEFVTVGR
jgi:hypothetical protein